MIFDDGVFLRTAPHNESDLTAAIGFALRNTYLNISVGSLGQIRRGAIAYDRIVCPF